MELVDFLRARLDEDEALAREAPQGPWHIGNAVDPTQPCNVHTFPGARPVADGLNWLVAEHVARHNPARVLAEIEAAQGDLRQYEEVREQVRHPVSPENRMRARVEQLALEDVLRRRARVHRDHPDFDPAWLDD